MKPTDLILNPDGSVYHLKLRPEELPDLVLLAGDPGRIEAISQRFDTVDFRRQNREFVSHKGMLNGTSILALSTGIGPDNMDIVMNELDALANIDLETRTPRETLRRLSIIRLGTSGTFQRDIAIGTLALATHGLGLDGSLYFYEALDSVVDPELTGAFLRHAHWPSRLPRPYIIEGSVELIEKLENLTVKGITATGGGFYGPQGREIRLCPSVPAMEQIFASFEHNGSRIVNFEMETSSLYGLGRMLGHRVASVCVVLANRASGEYSRNTAQDIERMIDHVLEQLTR